MALKRPTWALEEAKAGGAAVAPAGKSQRTEEARALVAQARTASSGSGGSVLLELVKALAKLSLANAEAVREITGVVFHCFILDADSPVSKALAATGERYFQEVERQGRKEHTLGPPFLHAWVALLETLLTTMMDKLLKEDLALIGDYWEKTVLVLPMPQLEEHVKQCRKHKTKQGNKVRLQLALAPKYSELEAAIVRALVTSGAERKIGPAPKRELERAAQRLLDKI